MIKTLTTSNQGIGTIRLKHRLKQLLYSESHNILGPKEFGQLHLSGPGSLGLAPLHTFHCLWRPPHTPGISNILDIHFGRGCLSWTLSMDSDPASRCQHQLLSSTFSSLGGASTASGLHLHLWSPGFSVGIPTCPDAATLHLCSMIPYAFKISTI